MKISNATIFTTISISALVFQYFILNQNINKLQEQNLKLSTYIKAGHRKHLAILRERDTEKNALIASYEYTINKEDKKEEAVKINEDFKKGYQEGYHRAIEDSYCPVEHVNKL